MRKERRKKFLDKDVELLNIDEAHDILLDVGGEQFKRNIQRWGAIHTEPCRSAALAAPRLVPHNSLPCILQLLDVKQGIAKSCCGLLLFALSSLNSLVQLSNHHTQLITSFQVIAKQHNTQDILCSLCHEQHSRGLSLLHMAVQH